MPHILVADDYDDYREFVVVALRRAGHTVTAVSTAGAAAEHLRAEHVDVALLDNYMPGMTGLELARRLRAETALRIMVMSGMTFTREILEDPALDHVTFLSKPFRAKVLLGAVEDLLDDGAHVPSPLHHHS